MHNHFKVYVEALIFKKPGFDHGVKHGRIEYIRMMTETCKIS